MGAAGAPGADGAAADGADEAAAVTAAPHDGAAAELRVLTALPHTAAILLQGALRAEGIGAQLARDGLAVVYGFDGGGYATRVLVPADEAARARRVLEALDAEV